MSNTQHTPGLWTVDAANPEFGLCIGDGAGIIAKIGPCSEPDNEDRANACLIAAAPELLEACQGLLWCDCARGSIDMRDKYHRMARAALKKAKAE